jgi:hypothetical protein
MGDGLLPLGKVGLLVADTGAGKTTALIQLAVSIITGRKWLGHFEIGHEARRGRVLLALAEDDIEEPRRKLFAIGRDLTPEERDRVLDRLVVLPLAGKPVELLTYGPNGRSLVDSPALASLRAKLRDDAGPDGWSLVVLDPLARWASEEAEKDNAVATRNVQAAETLLDVPGNPTVLLPHHASLDGVQTGNIRSRGVGGFRAGARWESYLREEGADVFFRQKKSNVSRPMPDEIRCVRGPHGLLRVASAAEEEERQEHAAAKVIQREDAKTASKVAHKETRIAAMMEPLLDALRTAKVPPTSQKNWIALVPGDTNIKQDAAARLVNDGRVEPVGKGKCRHLEVAP